MADANMSGDAGRPDPAKATTPAEFVEAMRALKRWTGFGLRRLEKQAAAGGHVLPRSTLTVALTRDTVPRAELVAAFAHACGCDEDETARWVAASRRVAAGTPEAPEPAPTPEPAPAREPAPALAKPPTSARRRARRLVPALLALAAAATLITYLLGAGKPGDARQGAEDEAPAPPGSSRTRTPGTVPDSSTVLTPGGEPVPTTGAGPGDILPIGLETPNPTDQPDTPAPGPQTPRPSPGGTVPPVPDESGRATFPVEGEAPVHCPMPWVVNEPYGPIAQCTQVSGGQARVGFYSGVTGKFSPSTDWLNLSEDRWFDDTVVATDGVEARACGYGVFETMYGAGAFATQFRADEGRWGTVNLIDGRLHPAHEGWQRTAP